MIKMEKTDWKT